MKRPALSPEISELVEQVGLVLEAEGLPRMAGRVLGYLLVADPPRQSIADLMAALKASNGSISTMTRLLEQQGYLQRISVPGERRDYFSLRQGGWAQVLLAASQGLEAFRRLFERALGLVPARHPSRASLEEGRDFFAFVLEKLPDVLAEWER